jgi:hypothetical protein
MAENNPLKIHNLRPAPGAKTAKTRVGRGEASKGKTAGRGTKGTKARYQPGRAATGSPLATAGSSAGAARRGRGGLSRGFPRYGGGAVRRATDAPQDEPSHP